MLTQLAPQCVRKDTVLTVWRHTLHLFWTTYGGPSRTAACAEKDGADYVAARVAKNAKRLPSGWNNASIVICWLAAYAIKIKEIA